MSRLQEAAKRVRAQSALLTLPQLASLTKQSPAGRVAIVSEAETTALADSLEALLSDGKRFTPSRFAYMNGGLKPERDLNGIDKADATRVSGDPESITLPPVFSRPKGTCKEHKGCHSVQTGLHFTRNLTPNSTQYVSEATEAGSPGAYLGHRGVGEGRKTAGRDY
jgi:hypothetical protein